jgi:hypothetical protein
MRCGRGIYNFAAEKRGLQTFKLLTRHRRLAQTVKNDRLRQPAKCACNESQPEIKLPFQDTFVSKS